MCIFVQKKEIIGTYMPIRRQFLMVAMAAVMHFLVDCLCVCCLYQMTAAYPTGFIVAIFVTYNVLAFTTQPLTGLMADLTTKRYRLLLAAILLLALPIAGATVIAEADDDISTWAVLTVATLLGTGNSFFHVWGGKETAVKTGNDLRAIGVFVSTGALGLSVGVLFPSWFLLFSLIIALAAISLIYAKLDVSPQSEETISETAPTPHFAQPLIWTAVGIIIGIVFFRSLLGEVFSAGIDKNPVIILTIGATAMIGKMAGGWIARRWGIALSMLIVMSAVYASYLLMDTDMVFCLAGIFLINLTMPVTLYLSNRLMPKREGLSFGLLAAALIPGYYIAQYILLG